MVRLLHIYIVFRGPFHLSFSMDNHIWALRWLETDFELCQNLLVVSQAMRDSERGFLYSRVFDLSFISDSPTGDQIDSKAVEKLGVSTADKGTLPQKLSLEHNRLKTALAQHENDKMGLGTVTLRIVSFS